MRDAQGHRSEPTLAPGRPPAEQEELPRRGGPPERPAETNLRAIESGDVDELIDLRASTGENAYSRQALREIGITGQSTADLLRTTHRGWLCEVGGVKAGFAIGDGSTGELWVVAVSPRFEGRGVGSRLLEAVESWLFSLGWNELWLWTSSDPRKRAFSFYARRGWAVSETRDAVVYMKKRAPGLAARAGAAPEGRESRGPGPGLTKP